MEQSQKNVLIVAGETSGDTHAAHLVAAIKEKRSDIKFVGLGGPQLLAQGITLYEDLTKYAVVGFFEVFKHYSHFKRMFNDVVQRAKKGEFKTAILVDYPGFNLRLAKALKKHGVKVIYYISPQVWAWKRKRVFHIKKYVDKMLVIFDFEKDFYDKYGVKSSFVGHPLVDDINIQTDKDTFLEQCKLAPFRLTIGLLPGSREKEVERHLPIMVKSAQRLHKKFPMLQLLIMKEPSLKKETFGKYLYNLDIPHALVESHFHDGVHATDVCMVASGTATLETALIGKPMVIIYKTSFLTWLLAKIFIKIPYIGLVNVVAGKKIVPECIQNQASPQHIAQECESMFTNEIRLGNIKSELRLVGERLGKGNAARNAADEVLAEL